MVFSLIAGRDNFADPHHEMIPVGKKGFLVRCGYRWLWVRRGEKDCYWWELQTDLLIYRLKTSSV
jgi:hypothetical protein